MSASGIRIGAQEAEDTEAKRPRVPERGLRNCFPSPEGKPLEQFQKSPQKCFILHKVFFYNQSLFTNFR